MGRSFADDLPVFQQFAITNGMPEKLKQSMYDSALYPAAGTTSLPFFQSPIGSGLSVQHGNANNTKTPGDTNMSLPGALPAGQAYLIESIEIDFQPGSSATANTWALQSPLVFNATAASTLTAGVDDVNAFYNTGYLALSIMSKPYLTEAPLLRFPPKRYRELDAAVASNSATTAEAAFAVSRACGKNYYLEVPMPWKESQNLSLTLNWPVAVATPSTKNGKVQVIFDGTLYRLSQ